MSAAAKHLCRIPPHIASNLDALWLLGCGFVKTKSEARRLIEGGGARLNDVPEHR